MRSPFYTLKILPPNFMHYKLFYILSFNINYYYHNYIKILLYRCTHRLAALCTFVVMVMNCSAVCDVWIRLSGAQLAWSSTSGVPGSGSSTGHLHLKSSSQVPLKFRFLIYYSTTLLEIMSSMFPRSSLSAGQTCLLDTSDVLWQMYCLRIYCRHALPTSRAN